MTTTYNGNLLNIQNVVCEISVIRRHFWGFIQFDSLSIGMLPYYSICWERSLDFTANMQFSHKFEFSYAKHYPLISSFLNGNPIDPNTNRQ